MKFVISSGLIAKEEVESAQRCAKDARVILQDTNTSFSERRDRYLSLMKPAEELVKRFEQKILEDDDFAIRAGELGTCMVHNGEENLPPNL